MSDINASTTLATAQASYLANASYMEDGSAAKAKAFVSAGNALLLLMPESAGTKDGNFQYRMDLIERRVREAQSWLASNDTGSGGSSGPSVTYVDLRNARC